MTPIIKYLDSKYNFEDIINSKKVIHCGNDESFAFYAYYKYINNPNPYT